MNAPTIAAALAAPVRFECLPLETIKPSGTNPRKHFDPVKLEELAASIRMQGVLQAILVRPECTVRVHQEDMTKRWYTQILNIAGKWNTQGVGHDTQAKAEIEAATFRNRYELVAGERRLRAAKLAKLATIPAVVRELTDIQVLEMQVVENLQRDDLHPIEEADGYERLIKKHGYTADSLAEKIGKSRSYIYGRLKLAALTPKSRDLFYDGKIEASTALLIARIPPNRQDEAANEIIEQDCSYRQAVDLVQDGYMVDLKGADFPIDDAMLLPKAGDCKACPKRSGNAKDLFTDVKNPNVCTDPDCFEKKREAHKVRLRAKLEAKGETVISGAQAKKIKPHAYSHELKEGYIELDGSAYLGGDYRTYRKALGKQPCATALLECPHTGKLLQVAKREDVNAALKANGIDPNKRAGGGTSSDQKARERKARLETEIRLRVMSEIRAVSRARQFDRDDTILVATAFFERLHFDDGKRLVDAWNAAAGVDKPKGNEYMRDFAKKIPALTDAELGVLLIDMALIGDCHVAGYCSTDGKDLLATAQRLGINATKIRADLTEAAKEKRAAKKKAVKK